MRNIIALLALTVLLAVPPVCDASYIIKLKNGREFITSRYWEEGSQIKFYSYGGIIGVDKNLISGIEESDQLYEYKEEKKVAEPEATEKPKEEAETDPFSKEPKKTSAPKEALKEDDPFVKEFKLLEERFSRVAVMTMEELLKLSKDLADFKKKVVDNRAASRYTDELAETYTMGDEVRDRLKTRGQ